MKDTEPNKQPFYHTIEILVTATRELTEKEILEAVERPILKLKGVVFPQRLEIHVDSEPGDPADLM